MRMAYARIYICIHMRWPRLILLLLLHICMTSTRGTGASWSTYTALFLFQVAIENGLINKGGRGEDQGPWFACLSAKSHNGLPVAALKSP